MRASLSTRNLLPVAAIAALLCIPAQAQQKQDFSKSVSAFPNVVAPYEPRHVEAPSFTNSDRINQILKDGKLMLSLNDAVAMGLENNLDLVIARYNLPIADTDILRTKSGQATRGVSTGLVQGTPGGGVGAIGSTGSQGGGAGGTSTAAGGAGTGAGGIVTSTLGVGPSVDNFDPILTSGLGVEHSNTPQSNIVFTGVSALAQNTGSANFGYQQGFPTGTLLSVSFNNSRVTSNSTRTFLVPQLNANYRLQLRQHLLQGWGITSNKRFIIQARNNREIADVSFRQQVIATVGQIENIYWNLVSAYQDVQAKQRAVELAKRLQTDNEKQVQIGTLAPIEVVSAESAVAARNQDLIISQTNLQLQQLLMKNAITRNQNDPVLAGADVVPTDTMALPTAEPITPVQDLIVDALQRRPELAQSRIDLTNREIAKRAARNALLPSLDAVGFYGGSALAGSLNPGFAGAPPGTVNTGYGDAFSNLGAYPDYFVGLNLTIPIRNRGAQADQVRSELEFRQAQVRLQQLQNQIGIEVRNAQFSVVQNRARVDAAQKGRDFAAQSLSAEQKKYALGASTTYNVLLALNNLASAESSLVAAMTAYEQSRVQLDQVTGRTLESLGIDVGDAESGTVTRPPNVPGVLPASQVTGQPTSPTGTTSQATPQATATQQPPAAPKKQ